MQSGKDLPRDRSKSSWYDYMDILEFENRDSHRSNGMIKMGGHLRTLTKSSVGSQDSTS